MCVICGLPDTYQCPCPKQEANCTNCLQNTECDTKYNAECVLYNYNDPNCINKLNCLQLPKGVNLKTFMEEVDKQLCYFKSCDFTEYIISKIKTCPGLKDKLCEITCDCNCTPTTTTTTTTTTTAPGCKTYQLTNTNSLSQNFSYTNCLNVVVNGFIQGFEVISVCALSGTLILPTSITPLELNIGCIPPTTTTTTTTTTSTTTSSTTTSTTTTLNPNNCTDYTIFNNTGSPKNVIWRPCESLTGTDNIILNNLEEVRACAITGSLISNGCDVINNGSCSRISSSTTTTSICTPVTFVGTPTLPDVIAGQPYNYIINLNGKAPFTLINIVKPTWMNINIVGNTIVFSGTPQPIDVGNSIIVSFTVTNCAGNSLQNFNDFISVISSDPATSVLTLDYVSGKFQASLSNAIPSTNISITSMFVEGTDRNTCTQYIESDSIFSTLDVLAGTISGIVVSNGLTCSTIKYKISNTATINGLVRTNGSVINIGGTSVTVNINHITCSSYTC